MFEANPFHGSMYDLYFYVYECETLPEHVCVVGSELDWAKIRGEEIVVDPNDPEQHVDPFDARHQVRVCKNTPSDIEQAKRDILVRYYGENKLVVLEAEEQETQEIKAAPEVPKLILRNDNGEILVFISEMIAYVGEKISFDDILDILAHNGKGLAYISYEWGVNGAAGMLRSGQSVYTNTGMKFELVFKAKQ